MIRAYAYYLFIASLKYIIYFPHFLFSSCTCWLLKELKIFTIGFKKWVQSKAKRYRDSVYSIVDITIILLRSSASLR